MEVRLSAPDWCFFRPGMEPDHYYQTLRTHGYAAVEMVAAERFQAARSAGLEILDLAAPGMMKGLNRREHHAKLLPQIVETLQLASEHAIPAVIVFSGNRDGQEDSTGLSNVCDALAKLLPEAEKLGVEMWFEMLCQQDHEDYQADHASYGFELCQRLASDWLKVLYDVYHMSQMGEDVATDITDRLSDVAHIHLADLPRRRCPRSDERVAFHAIRDRVMQAGYDGLWGMEFLPGAAPLEDARDAADYFRS